MIDQVPEHLVHLNKNRIADNVENQQNSRLIQTN